MEQDKQERNYNLRTDLESLNEDDIKWLNEELGKQVHNSSVRIVAQRLVSRLLGTPPTIRRRWLGGYEMAYKCNWCGSEVVWGDRYCRWCGHRIKWD